MALDVVSSIFCCFFLFTLVPIRSFFLHSCNSSLLCYIEFVINFGVCIGLRALPSSDSIICSFSLVFGKKKILYELMTLNKASL